MIDMNGTSKYQQNGYNVPSYLQSARGTCCPCPPETQQGAFPAPPSYPPAQGQPGETEIPESYYYVPGFLSTQVGKVVKAEFIVGTDTVVERTGILVGVGATYILLESLESSATTMCELESLKFITIYAPGDLSSSIR